MMGSAFRVVGRDGQEEASSAPPLGWLPKSTEFFLQNLNFFIYGLFIYL
jgi:hypothetical protein